MATAVELRERNSHRYKPLGGECDPIPNQSPLTKSICLAGLALTYCISIPSFCVSTWLFSKTIDSTGGSTKSQGYRPTIKGNAAFAEWIPLLLNIGVTCLIECMSLIHSITLRWCLQRENKLQFNSNLRIFTTSRSSWPNGLACTALYTFFVITTYAAASLIFSKKASSQAIKAVNGSNSDADTVYVSTIALMVVSAGLLGQALLATWAWWTVEVPTWSTHPIDTALACWQKGGLKSNDATMASVGEEISDIPQKPLTIQKSAWEVHKQVRIVLVLLWILFAFLITWCVAVTAGIMIVSPPGFDCQGCSVYNGPGWFPIPDAFNLTSPFVSIFFFFYNNRSTDILDPMSLLIICGFQTFLTIGIHCLDLLVNVTRDEDAWRTAYSPQGCDPTLNIIKSAVRSWQYMTVLIAKPVLHWMYGLGMTYTLEIYLMMRPAQLLYLSLMVLALAIGAQKVTKRGRLGPQPVTYGHLETLINLIDQWPEPGEKLFWGHKSQDEVTKVCSAGTSNKRLEPIRMDQVYM